MSELLTTHQQHMLDELHLFGWRLQALSLSPDGGRRASVCCPQGIDRAVILEDGLLVDR